MGPDDNRCLACRMGTCVRHSQIMGVGPYREVPRNQRGLVHADEALEDAATDDDIAAACLGMIRNGVDREMAIGVAIRELVRSRKELREMLTKYLENHATPMTILIEKKP